MFRGTTPTLVFNLNTDLDMDTIEEIWVTFDTPDKLTFTKDKVLLDNTAKTVTLPLSQDDTLRMKGVHIKCQIRLLCNDGMAYATSIKTVVFNDIIKDGVIK